MNRVQAAPGLRVAYQGEPGADAERCILTVFGAETIPVPQFTCAAVVEAVVAGSAHAGVLPMEHTTMGKLDGVEALLQRPDIAVISDRWLPVQHCLMCLPGQTLAHIRQILSHRQALAQCAEFLRTLPVQLIPAGDPAASARLIWERSWDGVAAIASRRAAEVYGLTILAEDIQTRADRMHFLLLAAQAPLHAMARLHSPIADTSLHILGRVERDTV